MLDDEQLELVRSELATLQRPLVLELEPGQEPDERFFDALHEVAQQLVDAVPDRLSLKVRPVSSGRFPALHVENVRYLAVPLDRELEPFLDLLTYLAGEAPVELPSPPPGPCAVKVLVAPTCPNCPAVVRACGQLAAVLPDLELVVVDVQYFTELAGSCRSVPTVVIDDAYTVVGPVTRRELVDLLLSREEPDYMVRSLRSMIEAGHLKEMARVLGSEESYPAIAAVMRDGTMQQKMGLMLAVDEVVEENPHGLDGAVPHLLPLLTAEVSTVRGDVADLLGRIGAPGARAGLTRLLTDEDADVREAAEEAIALLRAPS